jgi:hypothetical protein
VTGSVGKCSGSLFSIHTEHVIKPSGTSSGLVLGSIKDIDELLDGC